MKDDYQIMFAVEGNAVVAVLARRVANHWLVKQGCFRHAVALEKLSKTREEAEARLRALGPAPALEGGGGDSP
jgi:hypothetical protein